MASTIIAALLSCVCAVYLVSPAAGQDPGTVQEVELAAPFGTVAGKLVAADKYLIFLDQERPEDSFAIGRGDLLEVRFGDGMMKIELREPVRDRTGERTELDFRFVDPAGTGSVMGWLTPTLPRARNAGAPARTMIFEVRHKKPFGDGRGRLIITPSQIGYELEGDSSGSRQWEIEAIREVARPGPCSLRIVAPSGEEHEFELTGRGMTQEEFRELVDRITLARTKNRR